MPLSFYIRLRAFLVLIPWIVGHAIGQQNPQFDPPPGYYSSGDGLTGAALKAALNEIIRNHTVIPYTASSTDAWDALQELDEDPANPANVVLIYNGVSWPKADTNGNGQTGTNESWEREHCWAKSFALEDAGADTSDLFNLRACRRTVNASRGNRIYDQAGPGAVAPPNCPECLYDPNGSQGNLWTPRPSEKGDLARAMFYMAVRYDGRDFETVDLELGDEPNSSAGVFASLPTLIEWHQSDPVSEPERRRNHLIFSDYQGNRNPFIDHPEMVAEVFSTVTGLPALTLSVSPSAVTEGSAALGTVSIASPPALPIVIALSKTGDPAGSEVSLPATVTIPAGQTWADFTVQSSTDGAPDGDQSVLIKAEASGYETGVASLGVLDIDEEQGGGTTSTIITAAGFYTQDFNGLPATGSGEWTDDSMIAGWYEQRTGNGTTITANNGSSSTGGLYSYGSTAGDRALGSLGSANVATGSFAWGVTFQNATATPITFSSLAYTGEQWRYSGAAASQAISFSYQTGPSAVTDLTPGSDVGWTGIAGLAFESPITSGTTGPLDGNSALNSNRLTANLNLQLAPGQWITFRWRDIDHGGGDHGLAIDDFRLDWVLPPPVGSPEITSPLAAAAVEGVSFDYQIVATNDPEFFEAEGLPDGLSIDLETGLISGIPLLAGEFEVHLLAGNAGGFDAATLMLTVDSSGSKFAQWSGGAAQTDELLLQYAVGGASAPGAFSFPAVLSVAGDQLVLSAIIRTGDPDLSVLGEAVTDLPDFGNPGLVTEVVGTAVNVNQDGVPEGCERQEFRIPIAGAERKFLRLRADLSGS